MRAGCSKDSGSHAISRRPYTRRAGRGERYGGKAILLGRFVGVLRALTPFVAGTSGIALRRVLPYSAVSTLLWATTFTLVGYAFADSFETAGETVTRIVMIAAVVVGGGLLTTAAIRRRRGTPLAAELTIIGHMRDTGHPQG